MSRLPLALGSLILLLAPAATRAADPKSQPAADARLAVTAQAMFKNLRTETLPNGLRVYLLPVKNAPVVTTMVAYRVGSGDEDKDQTGLSHYLEHLMFKGTEKLKPGDIDRATQRNGGHNNAYTTEDRTVYHFDFAADRWMTALEIEADRMRNTRIDAKHEFEQEKGAVIAELKRNEDTPWDLEQKAILPLLFPPKSPYSHPVIGEEAHVRAATAEIITRYYDKWYHPNNAAIIVAGGFDPDEALARIKKLFGPIPKAELPPRKQATAFKDRNGPVRKEFTSKFELPRLLMGFNTIAVGDPDDPVLDLVQEILSDGRTARLYRKLVEGEQIATAIGASNQAGRYPGWFAVEVELLRDKDRTRAEDLVFAELERLISEPVSDEELNRARRKILAAFVFGRETVHGLAETIARASTYPGGEDVAKYYQGYLDRLMGITKADIQAAAKRYFSRKQAVLVWSVPKDAKAPAGRGPMPGVHTPGYSRSPLRGYASSNPGMISADSEGVTVNSQGCGPLDASPNRAEPATGSTFSLKNARRVVLPNGLTLIMMEDHRLPVVVARAAVRDVQLREPAAQAGIATLVGNLLEEGTARHTGQEIAALIENTGGSIGLSSAGGALRVLSPDTDLGLGLLFECLTVPSFPKDAFERLRQQQLASIADSETQPRTRAARLFNELVYGPHPYGRSSLGKKEVVAKLTAADCVAFHREAFAPNFTIVVVVGDFNSEEMVKKVQTLTAGWKKSEAKQPDPPAPPKPVGFTERIVTDRAAAQVHVFIGHLGITRHDPDYYKLLVMDNVLGTGPGFTDRLSATLRDRQGLAYTVNASITSTAGSQPGKFTGYIGTFPKSFLDVRHGFLREINRIRDEEPTKQEVEDAKKYLLGSLPFRFTSMSAVAGELLAAERYGLGFDFLETYRKEVAAVTPADVQAVAKKHLHPKALTIVAVGAIDADGKPLPRVKGGK